MLKKDLKAEGKRLRAAITEMFGIPVTLSQAYELTAKAKNYPDWNTAIALADSDTTQFALTSHKSRGESWESALLREHIGAIHTATSTHVPTSELPRVAGSYETLTEAYLSFRERFLRRGGFLLIHSKNDSANRDTLHQVLNILADDSYSLNRYGTPTLLPFQGDDWLAGASPKYGRFWVDELASEADRLAGLEPTLLDLIAAHTRKSRIMGIYDIRHGSVARALSSHGLIGAPCVATAHTADPGTFLRHLGESELYGDSYYMLDVSNGQFKVTVPTYPS